MPAPSPFGCWIWLRLSFIRLRGSIGRTHYGARQSTPFTCAIRAEWFSRRKEAVIARADSPFLRPFGNTSGAN